jgi:hypothetical protein
VSRRALTIIFIGLLLAVGSVSLLLPRPKAEPYLGEVTLSDGVTKYRLLKLTDGPLDYDWKNPSPQVLRWLPPRFRGPHVGFVPIHLDGFTQFNRFPGVSYYFRPVDSEGRYTNGPAGRGGMFGPAIDFQDSDGFVFGINRPASWPQHSVLGATGSTVSAIPRRDPILKILIQESRTQPGSPTHVMEIENPFYKPGFPAWRGEGLPQEALVDDPAAPEGARVTLRKLVFDDKGNLYDHSDFKVKAGTWYPFHEVWLEDATGNRGTRLSPFEPAWKVHFSLAPSPDVEYAERNIWRVGRFKRPADLALIELTPPESLAGLKIKSAILTGAGFVQTVNDKHSMASLREDFKKGVRSSGSTSFVQGKSVSTLRLESSQPLLVLKSLQTDNDFAVLTRLKSATKTMGFYHGSFASKDFQYTHTHFDRWPEDGEEWTLEVIYVKKPRVEFLVTPPDDAREILMRPLQR